MTDSTSPNADVRMRGFVQRVAVEQAWAWIDASLPPLAKLPKIEVALDEAAGRILADDVFSTLNVPSFARSMMDGFALHSEDTYGCTPYNPLPLNIRGRSLPGQPFSETLQRGEAIRIMTGAPLPAGADAVLPVEQTELARHSLLARHLWRVEQTELARHLWRVEQTELNDSILLARGEVSPGKHVGQVGEDIQAGEKLLPAGRWLRPQDIGVLASIGIASVPVIKRPVVRIIVTGNELLPAGTMPTGYNMCCGRATPTKWSRPIAPSCSCAISRR